MAALVLPEFVDHQLERARREHANRTAGSTVAKLAMVAEKSLIVEVAAHLTPVVVTLAHQTLVAKIGVKVCA